MPQPHTAKSDPAKISAAGAAATTAEPAHQKIVLVLQGGGALGAYQAGVYQALSEAGMEPDWVIGTSIGAINAAIIAGNPPHARLEKLHQLWQRLAFSPGTALAANLPLIGQTLANWMTMAGGLENFFTPNPAAFAGPLWPLGAEQAGYYTTDKLRRTLRDLINFDRVNGGPTRLTVGAAAVGTGEMRYFDTRRDVFSIDHIMASGALPPAFPAVKIGDEYYWDGGILSNTPVEAVFDDNPRESALVFAVHVWNPNGPPPETINQVMARLKDVQYASRAYSHIARQQQLHRLRHIIAELTAVLPAELRQDPHMRELASYGCVTKMHIVRLLAPSLSSDDQSKDIDFNPVNIKARWQAGYEETAAALVKAPWQAPSDPLEGFVLHEVSPDNTIRTR